MSPEEARFCLQEVDGHLSAAIQELIQMNPAGWQKPLQLASEGLLKMKDCSFPAEGNLATLLEGVRNRVASVERLLDSAASFMYGSMSSACPPSTEYTAGGEISDWREAGVVEAHG